MLYYVTEGLESIRVGRVIAGVGVSEFFNFGFESDREFLRESGCGYLIFVSGGLDRWMWKWVCLSFFGGCASAKK